MAAEGGSLVHVLWLLRAIKNMPQGPAPASALGFIEKWSPSYRSEAMDLRVAAYIQEQCDAAIAFIHASELTDEQKNGVLQTLTGLRLAFGLENIRNGFSGYLPHIDASISQLSFLVVGGRLGEGGRPAEADELAEAVDELRAQIDGMELDKRVAEIAGKHLHILATLLRNVQVVGVDAAFAAYFELCVRLQREARTAPASTQEKIKKLWPEIERWSGRIAIIEKAMEAGSALLQHAEGAFHLLLSNLS